MKDKILKLYENALNSFFGFMAYIFIGVIILAAGGFLLRAPHIFKFIGIAIIIGGLYFLLYYPIITNKKKK